MPFSASVRISSNFANKVQIHCSYLKEFASPVSPQQDYWLQNR